MEEEPSTTAEPNDYAPFNPTELVIPPFRGPFNQCINITIIGDDLVEDNEIIVLSVEPASEGGVVQFPKEDFTRVEVHIIDDDCKIHYSTVLAHKLI